MGKIYVCEHGCKYEGGSAFAASTSLVRAWKLIRDERMKGEAPAYDGQKRQKVEFHGPWHWSNGYDYWCIRVYDDA